MACTPTDIPGEVWKPYGNYHISNLGRVYHTDKQELRKPQCQYPGFHFHTAKQEPLHVAVMKVFGPKNPNPEYYDCIDHIDLDPTNNAISNLRWLPRWQNRLWSTTQRGFSKNGKGFQARIGLRSLVGKDVYLGTFLTQEEAHQRYIECRDRAMKLTPKDLKSTKKSIINYIKTGESVSGRIDIRTLRIMFPELSPEFITNCFS